MSHMVKKGIVFKKDDGTIFIIDRVLDQNVQTER